MAWLLDSWYCPLFITILSNLYAIFFSVFSIFSFVHNFNLISLLIIFSAKYIPMNFHFFVMLIGFSFIFLITCQKINLTFFTKQMNVSKESKVRPFYEKAPFFVDFRIYLFNITNKHEVIQGSEQFSILHYYDQFGFMDFYDYSTKV